MYAWNGRGRSQAVEAARGVRLQPGPATQSTELPPGAVLRDPLYLVIGDNITV